MGVGKSTFLKILEDSEFGSTSYYLSDKYLFSFRKINYSENKTLGYKPFQEFCKNENLKFIKEPVNEWRTYVRAYCLKN